MRPRHMATAPIPTRHKTAPSPLSQSTSALHLEPPNLDGGIQPYRKLSKRRKPVLQSLFSTHVKDSNHAATQAVSLPTSPDRSPSPTKTYDPQRFSALAAASPRKERRTSILGRLAKKFSLLKKPTRGSSHGEDEGWHHVGVGEVKHAGGSRPSGISSKHHSVGNFMEQGKNAEPISRAPRPHSMASSSVLHERGMTNAPELGRQIPRRSPSPVSLEAPVSRRLTIANPDSPTDEEGNNSTRRVEIPVPPKDEPVSGKLEIPVPPKDEPSRALHSNQPGHPLTQPSHPASSLLTHPSSGSTAPYQTAPTSSSNVDVPWTQVISDDEVPKTIKSMSTESVIPFPASPSLPEIPSLLSPPARYTPIPASLDDHHFPVMPPPRSESPLSTASLLVNPPTPHVPEALIPRNVPDGVPDAPAPAAWPPLEIRWTSQDRQSNGVTRQTETFKLVRSSSGNIYPAGEMIIAAGHQWEVVESDVPRRSKTKEKSSRSKDRESESRRDYRRRDKSRADSVEANTTQRQTSQTRQRSANGRVADPPTTQRSSSSSRPRSHSAEARHGNSASGLVGNEEYKANCNRDEERPGDRKHHDGNNPPNGVNIDKPQPPPPPPSPGPSQRERRPSLSISARPISELPSSAELNALRARDVWDMERLYKGRSMYETEPVEATASPVPVARQSMGSYAATKDRESASMAASHGSSHTAFVVQTSYQGQIPYPNIYHSMPVAPPPIIYSPQMLHHHDYNNPFPPSFSPDTSAMSSSRPPLPNPLPAPPRESSYKPAPIPATVLEANGGRSADQWTKWTSITTTH
jgi:hypothetical protein